MANKRRLEQIEKKISKTLPGSKFQQLPGGLQEKWINLKVKVSEIKRQKEMNSFMYNSNWEEDHKKRVKELTKEREETKKAYDAGIEAYVKYTKREIRKLKKELKELGKEENVKEDIRKPNNIIPLQGNS